MQELGVHGLWAGKQTAKGAPNAAPDKRLVQVAGDIKTGKDLSQVQISDLTKYADRLTILNSLLGQGSPVVLGTPEELAWAFYILNGGETTSAVTGPPAKTKHTSVPTSGLGFWLSVFRRVGLVDIQRHLFQDCKIGSLAVAGSTQQKDIRATLALLSLDPGVVKAADPAASMPTKDPFLFTDGVGRWVIDGVTFEGHTSFTFTANEDISPVFGEDVVPHDLVQGTPTVGINVQCYFDADGIAEFNTLLYGSAAPAANTKPLKTVGTLGSYLMELWARNAATGAVNGDKFKLAIAGVRWELPDAPDPNIAGGAAELTLSGTMEKVAGQPAYQVDIDCDAAAFT